MVAELSGLSSGSGLYSQSTQRTKQNDPMNDVADLLGMSGDDLHTALEGGQTLSDIAKSKGVSESDLESTIAKSLQTNPPPGAPALSDTQAASMAADIASGKGPHGGHGKHHHGSSDASQSLSALLSGQGTNTSDDPLGFDGLL